MLLKKISLFHLLPAGLAALITFAFVKTFPSKAPDLNFSAKQTRDIVYVPRFEPYRLSEQIAFSMALKQSVPVLMGSSELTSSHLKGLAHNFFNHPDQHAKLLSIGHAGFQCFGVLTTLAANRELLKNAKITIILSPGWFEDQYCDGISLHSFYEYATPNYLYQVLRDSSLDKDTRSYIAAYIHKNFDKISSPDETSRLMGKKSSTILNKAANKPFDEMNVSLLKERAEGDLYLISQQLILKTLDERNIPVFEFSVPETNWDSLMSAAKLEFKKINTNNDIAVENAYYDTWLRNKPKKHLVAVDRSKNQEFKDLQALVHFLKQADCKANFVIMPLNPKAHANLAVLDPIIKDITRLLDENKFGYLNMFSSDSSSYTDGTLEDIMHPYDLGWYRIDRFIMENYGRK